MLAEQICETFNRCFAQFHTKLVGGASEPLYEPDEPIARVYFREDYASSALHEVAHWRIAGADRRQQPDYGWPLYTSPSPRDRTSSRMPSSA